MRTFMRRTLGPRACSRVTVLPWDARLLPERVAAESPVDAWTLGQRLGAGIALRARALSRGVSPGLAGGQEPVRAPADARERGRAHRRGRTGVPRRARQVARHSAFLSRMETAGAEPARALAAESP